MERKFKKTVRGISPRTVSPPETVSFSLIFNSGILQRISAGLLVSPPFSSPRPNPAPIDVRNHPILVPRRLFDFPECAGELFRRDFRFDVEDPAPASRRQRKRVSVEIGPAAFRKIAADPDSLSAGPRRNCRRRPLSVTENIRVNSGRKPDNPVEPAPFEPLRHRGVGRQHRVRVAVRIEHHQEIGHPRQIGVAVSRIKEHPVHLVGEKRQIVPHVAVGNGVVILGVLPWNGVPVETDVPHGGVSGLTAEAGALAFRHVKRLVQAVLEEQSDRRFDGPFAAVAGIAGRPVGVKVKIHRVAFVETAGFQHAAGPLRSVGPGSGVEAGDLRRRIDPLDRVVGDRAEFGEILLRVRW